MSIARIMAAQLREPSGLAGRILMGAFFDRTNRDVNTHVLYVLEIAPTDKVLEVGFGGGATLAGAADKASGGTVVGVELSPVMIRRARRKCRKYVRQGRVELFEGDVYDLPFAEGEFDRAYSVNTLYFWDDPTVALREIRRVLKEKGRLVLAVRSAESLAPYQFPDEIMAKPSLDGVQASLEGAGFREIHLEHRDKGEKLDSLIAVAHA